MKKGGKHLKKEKRRFVEWVREHKKKLILAGVSVATILGLIIGIKNRAELEEAWSTLKTVVGDVPKATSKTEMPTVIDTTSVSEMVESNIQVKRRIPHDVAEHLRNLPDGCNASAEKIATAAEHGYVLLPGQTWVDSYRTGGLAA